MKNDYHDLHKLSIEWNLRRGISMIIWDVKKRHFGCINFVLLLELERNYGVSAGYRWSQIHDLVKRFASLSESNAFDESSRPRLRLLDRLESPRKYRTAILINQPGEPFLLLSIERRARRFVEADTTKYVSPRRFIDSFFRLVTIKREFTNLRLYANLSIVFLLQLYV